VNGDVVATGDTVRLLVDTNRPGGDTGGVMEVVLEEEVVVLVVVVLGLDVAIDLDLVLTTDFDTFCFGCGFGSCACLKLDGFLLGDCGCACTDDVVGAGSCCCSCCCCGCFGLVCGGTLKGLDVCTAA